MSKQETVYFLVVEMAAGIIVMENHFVVHSKSCMFKNLHFRWPSSSSSRNLSDTQLWLCAFGDEDVHHITVYTSKTCRKNPFCTNIGPHLEKSQHNILCSSWHDILQDSLMTEKNIQGITEF